jgi:hypothetical protein
MKKCQCEGALASERHEYLVTSTRPVLVTCDDPAKKKTGTVVDDGQEQNGAMEQPQLVHKCQKKHKVVSGNLPKGKKEMQFTVETINRNCVHVV